MRLATKRLVWQPGATNAATAFSLPTTAPRIAAVLAAQILRSSHDHTAFTVDATAAAGDITAFVGVIDGAGAAVTGVTIGHAGGAGADIDVPTSSATDTISVVAATPTFVSATQVSLSAALLAADLVVLDVVEEGAFPAAA